MQTASRFVNYFVACTTVLCSIQSIAVHAAIGETKQELVKRFGTPDETLNGSEKTQPAESRFTWFKQKGYQAVFVYIIDGRSAFEFYILEQDATGPNDPLLTTLLEASAGGEEWKPVVGERLAGLNVTQKEIAKLSNDVPGYQYFWHQRKSGSTAYLSNEKPLREFFLKSRVWEEAVK